MTTTSLIDCPHCGRSAQIATEGRSIHFCPVRVGKKVVSRDYAGYYDGELRGGGGSYLAVEQQLDAYVYDLLSEGQCATAQALDGGSDADVMAAEVVGMVVAR